MTRRLLRHLVVFAAATTLAAVPARAQDDCPTPPHVRGATEDTASLLHELVDRSPTARELVDQLEQSDVIVYVRHEWFSSSSLRGRIGFLTAAPTPRRMLVIELASRYTRIEQLSALGHELQHAFEISRAPSVHDSESLAALYRKIGEASGRLAGSETFETAAAAATGRRVRVELITGATANDAVDADRN
jgi:hypothetical protein